ncbi:hypothetical protein BDY17DRAFT_120507 [Neohortaea acidophila]|uniref:Uncharacterized protein n=1 Tax=Neohortaea acidophila TaxID=245834 RepID=A0A6A6PV92_9PEZI|nr:uncharacterized protein BDY17DRAFT_120507 [Neohortaea acidophila]KAF2484058.1 hypothetical protein BDY17DRAFT_120507 [Neohortaea acidophila]
MSGSVNLQIYDDIAKVTLTLRGGAAQAAYVTTAANGCAAARPMPAMRQTHLTFTASSTMDIKAPIPDTHGLDNRAARHQSREEATNPAFPEDLFSYDTVSSSPARCLYTIAELDEFIRAAPTATFQGYLSLLIVEVNLVDCFNRHTLLSGACCHAPVHANALTATCKRCNEQVSLRLNPLILGQVVDETAAIEAGGLLLSDRAWRDFLGRGPEALLDLDAGGLKQIADRLVFCRLTTVFGWTPDQSRAGGRICVMRFRS